jgi:hypothetical protein|tara:strand:+ start:4313 stop:4702 length:390 start_codon:yes stop_codon:yes gene_type:complete
MMKGKDIQKLVKENSARFKLLISGKIFKIDEIKVFQNENPVTKSTIRGGVYVSDIKEMKVQATIFDTSITKYLATAMLGPNKTFLDILIESEINNESKISLVTNLTNTMQNSSKIVLYLILKDVIIKSD